MSMEKRQFDNEDELHSYVEANIEAFFGDVIYLKGFRITTRRNKAGIPDGFILDLINDSWTIIESELLDHGVWEHIAEQIMRYIVASQNSSTKKKIRGRFFEEIEKRGEVDAICLKLNIPQHKLMQKIENIVDPSVPDIAIFIDRTNEDLQDMANAMRAPIKIFKVQKYCVNGNIEYFSPQGQKPTFETIVEDVVEIQSKPSLVIEALGGGKLVSSVGRINIFVLNTGEIVASKYSKYYESDKYYWYALSVNTLDKYEEHKVESIAFTLGDEGVVKVPSVILKEYLKEAGVSRTIDGSIRQYQIYIKKEPEPILFTNKTKREWNLEDYFVSF